MIKYETFVPYLRQVSQIESLVISGETMIFHMDVIKECFPTWVSIKILETLMRQPKAMSQRQLARVIGLSRTTAHRALHDLGQAGLLKPQTIGSATHWEIDKQSYLYETLHPLLESLSSIESPVFYLKNLIRKTLTLVQGARCFIFGSIGEGTDHSSSDIDLALALSHGMKASFFTKEIEVLQDLCREKFGKRVSVIFVPEKELKKQNKELYKAILKGIEVSS